MSLKRKRLSLKDKIFIIMEHDKHDLSSRKLAEKFGVGKTQINDIIKNKNELKKMFKEGYNMEQKRKFPMSAGLLVDQIVFRWFCEARNKNIPLSGPLLKQKALEAAWSLNVENFAASNGWLNCFCKRHNIALKSLRGESADVNLVEIAWKTKLPLILNDCSTRDMYNADETGLYNTMPTKTCGESADVNLKDIDTWKTKLPLILKDCSTRDICNADETGLYRAMPTKTCGESANVNLKDIETWKTELALILKDYSTRDIYCVDETGLYYRAMPAKTFNLKSDKCAGKKVAKQRLTILLCTNMEGEKEDPLIIGKSKNPTCCKGSHIDKLPLEWVSNKMSWMTTEIMTKWLHKFDNKMKKQNRNVLLFLDNAVSHAKVPLQNVKLVFLPPNTRTYQPLDQGIIYNFKIIYRHFLINRLLTLINSECNFENCEKSINLTSALIWITAAWEKVSPTTIKRCFSNAGFSEVIQESESYCEEDEIPLSQLFPSINDKIVSLQEFVSIDSDAPTESSDFSITEIVDELCNNDGEHNSDSNSDVDDCENPISTFSNMSEVCEKLRDMQNYFLCNNDKLFVDISQILLKCEAEVYNLKLKNL